MEYVTLRNGSIIPSIGLGTWQITDRKILNDVIAQAYKTGYCLIDTAAAYGNEIALSKAIAVNGIDRSNLILSDKVWNTNRGYTEVQEACKRTLKKLKTDYLDIYLIHWPASMKLYPDWAEINANTWRGMEQLYKDGFVKNIGVCNFKVHHLEELKKTAEIMPFINQIEFHPGFMQNDIYDYCNKNGIQIEASSPLGNGQILSQNDLFEISKRKNKTVAQICLRWGLQKNVILIPKTTKIDRLKDNIDIFDFELNKEEMELIDNVPYCGGLGFDSDEVTDFG